MAKSLENILSTVRNKWNYISELCPIVRLCVLVLENLKNINFAFVPNKRLMFLCVHVPILKHITAVILKHQLFRLYKQEIQL